MAAAASQTAVIVDVFLETIVYGETSGFGFMVNVLTAAISGFSAFLFPLALRVLCRKRSFGEINRTMLLTTCLLFALSTTVRNCPTFQLKIDIVKFKRD
jgi:hypothetical protein